MIIGVYVGLCLLGYLFQGKLLYQPYVKLEGTPAAMTPPLAYEDASFDTADGLTLHGWWVPADNAVATVIFCHGNAGNISHRTGTIRIFHDLGLNTFIFDYRGYGQSDGSPTEEGTYLDGEGAWRYVTQTKQVPLDRVFIAGRSLGGAVAAHLAWKHPPRGVILESTFT
ncbi:MAG TPA: alpha/beta fold hydrolase, partial [Planctomycetota bacterium]|nr:alpha/beta fold hydrolase [Planctomycetota bacterium]